jgi:hypothetical protein
MTNVDLAESYMKKARMRLEILDLLRSRGGYSDLLSEAQEIVELATKAILRRIGIGPPKKNTPPPIPRGRSMERVLL